MSKASKANKYQVTLDTANFLSLDEIFEESYQWGDCLYNHETYQQYKKLFKSFIPKKYLKIVKSQLPDLFRENVLRSVCQAYTNDLESQVVKLAEKHIRDTIDNNEIAVFYTLDFTGSTLLGFSEEITLTFDRKQVIQFDRERGYEDRHYMAFVELVEENIWQNKRNFDFDVDASYYWDKEAKLKAIWDDYNEVIPAIEKLLKDKQAVVKKNIKGKIPLIYRQKNIDKVF